MKQSQPAYVQGGCTEVGKRPGAERCKRYFWLTRGRLSTCTLRLAFARCSNVQVSCMPGMLVNSVNSRIHAMPCPMFYVPARFLLHRSWLYSSLTRYRLTFISAV